jgi:hypothetical protein
MPPKDTETEAPDEAEAPDEIEVNEDPVEAEFDEDLAQFADEPAEDEDRSSVTEAAPAAGEEGEPASPKAEAEPAAEPAEEAESAAAPEATPAEEAVAPAEAAPEAPAPEQPPAVEPTPPVVAEQPQPQATAAEVQEAIAAQRTAAEEMLSQHYALPTELAEGLDPEIAEFIPKLGAKIFMDATTHVLQQVTQMLPVAVQQINTSQNTAAGFEDQFFTRWPALREHADRVTQFGAAYRQFNPQATPEQFIQEVGAQTSVALRVPIPGEAPAAPAEAAPVPFQPAAQAAPRAGKAESKTMFEQLDDDLFADEAV